MPYTILLLAFFLAGPAQVTDPEEALAPEQVSAQVALPPPSLPTPVAPAPAPVPAGSSEPRFTVRRVDLGAMTSDTDTNSSKFEEYGHFLDGGFLPFARLAGTTANGLGYDLSAGNAFQRNAKFAVDAEKGAFRLRGSFVRIPHAFGNDARSLLSQGENAVLDDNVQRAYQQAIEQQYARNRAGVNFAFLNALVSPALARATPFDIALQRNRGQLELRMAQREDLDLRLTYTHEDRNGSRGSGTAFGFGNVVETAEPIDYRTQDLGLSAEYSKGWGLVRGGVRLNQFTNHIPVQTFDNPFRITDSTDASAYQAPGSASIGGAAVGRIALPPDNRSMTANVGTALKLGKRTRLSADLSYGQWTQDQAFIPFSTTSAIVLPLRASDLSTLPTRSLDGKVNVLTFSSQLSTRPAPGLQLTAKVRRYDFDNQTPRIEFHEGYVRFDGVWEDIPRISVPYGYTNDQAQATASYRFGPATAEAGYRVDRMDRTFRESERTTQKVGFASLNVRTSDWLLVRVTGEAGNREYDGYHFAEAEEASFLDPGVPANLPSLRRSDQANKDVTRVISQLQITPVDTVVLSVGYIRSEDDYKDLGHGLINATTDAFTAEADFTPNERFSVFGFYSRENLTNFLRGRQSGAAASVNPLDDWTSNTDDLAQTVGGGGTFGLWKDKLDLNVNGSYQKVDGNNDFFAAVGGAPEVARRAVGGIGDIPNFDDTKLLSLGAELAYRFQSRWTARVGGVFEDYELRDAFSTGLVNYIPGSMFLAGNDQDYRGHTVYTSLSCNW
jgi:MtrB/PioB family decaheme-associated outer membrane protein